MMRRSPSAMVALGLTLAAMTGCVSAPARSTSPSLTVLTERPEPSTAQPNVPPPTPDPFADQILATEVDAECGPSGPSLVSRRVRTSAEGVRFVATGPVGWSLNIASERGSDGLWLETGLADQTLLLPPGDVELSCSDGAGLDGAGVKPLRIEDPDSLYRTVDVGAANGCVAGSNSFGEGAVGEQGAPVELARAHVSGVASSDILERGGYPVQSGLVRIVRSGKVIGYIAFDPDGHDGWLSGEWILCEGLAGG